MVIEAQDPSAAVRLQDDTAEIACILLQVPEYFWGSEMNSIPMKSHRRIPGWVDLTFAIVCTVLGFFFLLLRLAWPEFLIRYEQIAHVYWISTGIILLIVAAAFWVSWFTRKK